MSLRGWEMSGSCLCLSFCSKVWPQIAGLVASWVCLSLAWKCFDFILMQNEKTAQSVLGWENCENNVINKSDVFVAVLQCLLALLSQGRWVHKPKTLLLSFIPARLLLTALLSAFPTILSCPAPLLLLPLFPSAFPAFSPAFVCCSPLRLCYSFCGVPGAGACPAPPSASPAPPGRASIPSSPSLLDPLCRAQLLPFSPPPPLPLLLLLLLLLQKQFWPAPLPNNEALTSFPWEKISQPNTSHWQELFLIFSLFPSPIAPT